MIRVVVADDQELVRAGLTRMLNAQPDIQVIGEAADGQRAVELARRLRPDVCLFDICLPGVDGIEATRALAGPDVADPLAVVVVTTSELDQHVYAALRAGARGFLLKDAGPDLLVQGVRAAVGGDALIAPTVTTRLLRAFASAGPAPPVRTAALGPASPPKQPIEVPRQPIEPLTDREEQVLAKVAAGRSNSEIATELYLTLSTVKTHITSLMTKLGARNRVELAMWAYDTNRVKARPKPR